MNQEKTLKLFLQEKQGTCQKVTAVEACLPTKDEIERGDTVKTYENGVLETENTIANGMVKVRKLRPHQDTMWLIGREHFDASYVHPTMSHDWIECCSKGVDRFFAIVSESMFDTHFRKGFKAPWNEIIYVHVGGALVGTEDEVWFVAKDSFRDTYVTVI